MIYNMKMEIFGGFGVKPESRELQNRLARRATLPARIIFLWLAAMLAGQESATVSPDLARRRRICHFILLLFRQTTPGFVGRESLELVLFGWSLKCN
jgi:hypothetical protein